MPSDETRRLLRTFGVAVTTYEDAVEAGAPADQIDKAEAEYRATLSEGRFDRAVARKEKCARVAKALRKKWIALNNFLRKKFVDLPKTKKPVFYFPSLSTLSVFVGKIFCRSFFQFSILNAFGYTYAAAGCLTNPSMPASAPAASSHSGFNGLRRTTADSK